MTQLRLTTLIAALSLLLVTVASCSSSGSQSTTFVLYGFSILDNVMTEEIIPEFQRHSKDKTGQDVRIITSFAGSGTITNQIIFGAPAQVAMVATEIDARHIDDAGLTTTDWSEFKNSGRFTYSTTVILTRAGNPKGLYSFEDLTRDDVEVVFPDPTTSGGAQWAVLALYGSSLMKSMASTGIADHEGAVELLKQVTLNASRLPESARKALTQFGLGYGDALLTYENEALLDISSGRGYEVVIPSSTIYIQPKVLIIDKNVGEGQRQVVSEFVEFLWTERAQMALARNNFRVPEQEVMDLFAEKFQTIQLPFTVDELGGWERATSEIIEQTWRQIQREN